MAWHRFSRFPRAFDSSARTGLAREKNHEAVLATTSSLPGLSAILTQQERDEVAKQLKVKGATNPCELCGNPHWSIGERLVAPSPLRRTGAGTVINIADPIYVSAVVACKKCGNTKLVNLRLLGLAHIFDSPADGVEPTGGAG